MSDTSLNEQAQMAANRLAKNGKRLAKWLRQNDINCYRLYDADIPEFAAAVDVYKTDRAKYAVVQEYKAPKSVDTALAAQRLTDLVTAVGHYLALPVEQVVVKSRQRQRGTDQYQKAEAIIGREMIAREGAAALKVNLHDYLDTGLFLDHRPIRRYMFQQARDKRVLNLFCYTASVSVQAALGGAAETLSIDLSNTYLDWARRNFLLNKLDKKRHKLAREDCLEWLAYHSKRGNKKFDLIFLDPPSFSNSKRMDSVLDIQRDHVKLVRQCMRLLAPGGTLVFSNNLRSFKLDETLPSLYDVTDYNKQSLDPDFERNPKIHQCFLIRRKEKAT